MLGRLCDKLVKAVTADKKQGWDNEFEAVYELAEVIMARTMKQFMAS